MKCSSRKGDEDYVSRAWPFQPDTPVRAAGAGWARRDGTGRWWFVSRGGQRPTNKLALLQPPKGKAGVNHTTSSSGANILSRGWSTVREPPRTPRNTLEALL